MSSSRTETLDRDFRTFALNSQCATPRPVARSPISFARSSARVAAAVLLLLVSSHGTSNNNSGNATEGGCTTSATYPLLRDEGAPAKAGCMFGNTCLPKYACEHMMVLPNWNLCLDTLYDDEKTGGCLVYSFGIADEWGFDLNMARLGCEVHMFDPTITLKPIMAPNLFFHKWGLYGGDLNTSSSAAFKHKVYGKIEGEMLKLPEILHRLGHTQRTISVFKIDCEGCEWEALGHMSAHNHPLKKVKQLLIELHFATTLGLQSAARFDLINNTFAVLWGPQALQHQHAHPHPHGSSPSHFGQFWHNFNEGNDFDRFILPELVAGGVKRRTCCTETGFVRTAHDPGCPPSPEASAARLRRSDAHHARAMDVFFKALDGKIIKGRKNEHETFFFSNGTKHSFPSLQAFTSYGYDFGDTPFEDQVAHYLYPLGPPCCDMHLPVTPACVVCKIAPSPSALPSPAPSLTLKAAPARLLRRGE